MSDKRRKSQLVLAFEQEDRGEAPTGLSEGTSGESASRHWRESRPTKEVLAWTG